jgi:hypothetical protein
MRFPSAHWIRGFLFVILYCVILLKVIISGFRPGPNDSNKMVDRIIRAGGGIFLLLVLLVAAYVFNRY